jgi:hypothetical protein
MVRSLHVSAAIGTALVLQAAPSAAAIPGSADDNAVSYERPPTARRGGFAMGLDMGPALVDFSGYPNKVDAIGDPAQLAATGPALGSTFNLWAGGAVRDWLTAGAGIFAFNALTGDYTASSFAFALHLEGYPLYFKGGAYRDLGLSIDAGIGAATMYDRNDTKREHVLADAGSASFLAASAFWEPFHFWHFRTGPSVTLGSAFSQTLTANQLTFGWRLVFYASP